MNATILDGGIVSLVTNLGKWMSTEVGFGNGKNVQWIMRRIGWIESKICGTLSLCLCDTNIASNYNLISLLSTRWMSCGDLINEVVLWWTSSSSILSNSLNKIECEHCIMVEFLQASGGERWLSFHPLIWSWCLEWRLLNLFICDSCLRI